MNTQEQIERLLRLYELSQDARSRIRIRREIHEMMDGLFGTHSTMSRGYAKSVGDTEAARRKLLRCAFNLTDLIKQSLYDEIHTKQSVQGTQD